MRPYLILAVTSALFLVALPVLAQPPAETCGPGDSLTGMDTLPFDQTLSPGTDDLTMSGTGCNERGPDHVTCLTPTNSCTVQATCSENAGRLPGGGLSPEGLQIAINAFEGACSTSPASCLDSAQGTGSGTITGLALTGGTTYCFVCETDITTPVRLEIQEQTGACGSLPVTLEGFTIE